jgi:hypothetical protein
LGRNAQGNVFDGAHIGRYIFTFNAVAARCALHQQAVLVSESNRQAVNLRLHHKFQIICGNTFGQQFGNSIEPVVHIFVIKRIAQTGHGDGMDDFFKTFQRFSANALGGRIGRDQFGMIALNLAQFIQESIIFIIADNGIIQRMVAIEMVIYFGA